MTRRPLHRRWPVWAFAAALLLKAAMPWLASASAQMQGKTLVEVCTVYGVSLVSVEAGESGAPQPIPAQAGHDTGHCPLTAAVALASADVPPISPTVAAPSAAPPVLPRPSLHSLDACAKWVAGLKHGPPLFA